MRIFSTTFIRATDLTEFIDWVFVYPAAFCPVLHPDDQGTDGDCAELHAQLDAALFTECYD